MIRPVRFHFHLFGYGAEIILCPGSVTISRWWPGTEWEDQIKEKHVVIRYRMWSNSKTRGNIYCETECGYNHGFIGLSVQSLTKSLRWWISAEHSVAPLWSHNPFSLLHSPDKILEFPDPVLVPSKSELKRIKNESH